MFTFKSIDGEPIALSEHNGKAILVVNTASRCGLHNNITAFKV